jgi:hypothetical protein
LGFIDPFGNFILNLKFDYLLENDYNVFQKMAFQERISKEKHAKVEAYKMIYDIIETEALKYAMLNIYRETVNLVVNWRKEGYNPMKEKKTGVEYE